MIIASGQNRAGTNKLVGAITCATSLGQGVGEKLWDALNLCFPDAYIKVLCGPRQVRGVGTVEGYDTADVAAILDMFEPLTAHNVNPSVTNPIVKDALNVMQKAPEYVPPEVRQEVVREEALSTDPETVTDDDIESMAVLMSGCAIVPGVKDTVMALTRDECILFLHGASEAILRRAVEIDVLHNITRR